MRRIKPPSHVRASMDSTNILEQDERSPTEVLSDLVFSRIEGESKSRKCVAMFPGES
jgi:hypothetical protein